MRPSVSSTEERGLFHFQKGKHKIPSCDTKDTSKSWVPETGKLKDHLQTEC
jgi:hypothetical protein